MRFSKAWHGGLTPVATSVGGTPSLAGSGIVLIPSENPKAMADALCDLMAHDDERVKRGQNARAYIASNHDVENLVWY